MVSSIVMFAGQKSQSLAVLIVLVAPLTQAYYPPSGAGSPLPSPLTTLHSLHSTSWAPDERGAGAQTRPALGANTQGCSQSYSQLGREITQTLVIIRRTCDEKEKFLQINFVMT